MNVKGDMQKLRRMRQEIKRLPAVQEAIARSAAAEITAKARASFASGSTAYDRQRPANKDGSPRTLHRTGKLAATLLFKAEGRRMRCVLAVAYARFRVKDGILPRGGAPLPEAWSGILRRVTDYEISVRMRRVG